MEEKVTPDAAFPLISMVFQISNNSQTLSSTEAI
jgi:hypothetical protein